jgi:type III pantothenate kinase
VNVLLIDIGNARVKWALSDAGRLGPVRRTMHGRDAASVLEAVRSDLRLRPRRIIVSNVAGAEIAEYLALGAREACGVEPSFVVSKASELGIRSAYARPERLGVDRWVAMIAAHARSQSIHPGATSCIIDAGTAVTFDAIRGDGQHLGGLIMAGPRLQAEALGTRTSDIGAVAADTRFPGDGLALLGRSTEEAVSHGAWLAIAGALTRACEAVDGAFEGSLLYYLCGGYARQLRDWLAFDVDLREDLVLEGLALISRAEEGD